MNWFYSKDGQQLGPVPFADIERLFAEGQLTGESLVWQQGTPNWVPLSTVLPIPTEPPAPAAPTIPPIPAAPAPAATLAPASPALPDYGSILCWGFIGVLVPCLGLLVYLALFILHLLEFFAVRKAVEAGQLAPSSYSKMNPVLFILGLFCCGGLLYPLYMHYRGQSGYFKPQPHAVTVAIVVVILNIILSSTTGYLQYGQTLNSTLGN